jgi:hypothetical protein
MPSYDEPCLPLPLPPPVLDRLAGLRTIGLLVDDEELIVTAVVRCGVTTRADWRAFNWIGRSRAWPEWWTYNAYADGDLKEPGALV